MRKIFFLSVVVLVVYGTLNAQSYQKKIQELDTYIEASRQQWKVPGLSVAIVKDGEVLLCKSYGEKELGSGDMVNTQTIFKIASTSKAFTAVAMGMLVDAGKVNWDDKVIDHLPEFALYDAYATRDMRIRDLFIHNLGLPATNYFYYEADFSTDEILQRMKYIEPVYPFRGGFIYQNMMYAAAGKIIEIISGTSWEDFIQKNIFDPLSMNNSYPNDRLSQIQSNRFIPHAHPYGKQEIIPIEVVGTDPIAPAGGIWSCIDDMSKWVVCMLDSSKYKDGKLLSPETWSEIFTPQVIIPKKSFYPFIELTQPKWTSYGIGWFQMDYNGRAVDFHTGSLSGLIAEIGLIHKEGLGYFFQGNMDHAEVRHAIMLKAFDLFGNNHANRDWSTELLDFYEAINRKAKLEVAEITAQRIMNTKHSLDLSEYVGSYKHLAYGNIDIILKEGNLHLTNHMNFHSILIHWSFDTFKMPIELDVNDEKFFDTVQFQIGVDGKVKSLSLVRPGFIFIKSE